MTPEAKDVWMAALPVIGTILGTVIGIAGTVVLNGQTRRSDERKQLQVLAFNSGIENWKQVVELAKREGGEIMPLDFFILNMVSLAHTINQGQGDLTEDKLRVYMLEKTRLWGRLMALHDEIQIEDVKKETDDRTTA